MKNNELSKKKKKKKNLRKKKKRNTIGHFRLEMTLADAHMEKNNLSTCVVRMRELTSLHVTDILIGPEKTASDRYIHFGTVLRKGGGGGGRAGRGVLGVSGVYNISMHIITK